MESGIEGYIETNKTKFNIVYEKLLKLVADTEADLNAINKVFNELPQTKLSLEEEVQLNEFFNTIETKEKMYQLELNKIEGNIEKFQSSTMKYIEKIPLQLKGPVQIAKSSLLQLYSDQLKVLNETFEQAKFFVMEILKRLKELNQRVNPPNVNYKKIREFIQNYIDNLLATVQNNSVNESHQEMLHTTLNRTVNLNADFNNLHNEFDNFKDEVFSGFERLNEKIDVIVKSMKTLETQLGVQGSKIKEINSELSEELFNLKSRTSSKLKELDETINNTSIKRFYV